MIIKNKQPTVRCRLVLNRDTGARMVASCENKKHKFCLRRISRKLFGYPTSGFGYWLCRSCSPRNHAEIRTIKKAIKDGWDVKDGLMYLTGHWHACEPCQKFAKKHGVTILFETKGEEQTIKKMTRSEELAEAKKSDLLIASRLGIIASAYEMVFFRHLFEDAYKSVKHTQS